jgi:hypothetical protein
MMSFEYSTLTMFDSIWGRVCEGSHPQIDQDFSSESPKGEPKVPVKTVDLFLKIFQVNH